MPANKYALLRYRIIDRCLRNSARPFPDKEVLRAACEDSLFGSDGGHISLSSIEKDIWAMRYESELGFYAPIEYHPGKRGYFYTDEEYSISDVSLSEEDMSAIRFAALTLEQFKDVPVFAGYENAIQKVIDRLRVAPEKEKGLSRFVLFEKEVKATGSSYLGAVIDAIRMQKTLEITYKKFGMVEESKYLIEPLLLKEYRNMWYVVAKNVRKNRIATFGLDRIADLHETGASFDLPGGFDPDIYFANSVGITVNDSEPLHIVIRFKIRWLDYLIAHPIHLSQKVSSVDESGFLVSLDVSVSSELMGLLLGFGEDAVVESPKVLREKMISIINSCLSNYKDK